MEGARPWFPGSWTQRAFSLPAPSPAHTSPTLPSSALLIALAPALPQASVKVVQELSLEFFQSGADGVRSVYSREQEMER